VHVQGQSGATELQQRCNRGAPAYTETDVHVQGQWPGIAAQANGQPCSRSPGSVCVRERETE
jgi:hypothetical protein